MPTGPQLAAELADTCLGNLELLGRLGGRVADCQALGQCSLAAVLDSQPGRKIQPEGDLVGDRRQRVVGQDFRPDVRVGTIRWQGPQGESLLTLRHNRKDIAAVLLAANLPAGYHLANRIICQWRRES
jgi:hypothetical protein